MVLFVPVHGDKYFFSQQRFGPSQSPNLKLSLSVRVLHI